MCRRGLVLRRERTEWNRRDETRCRWHGRGRHRKRRDRRAGPKLQLPEGLFSGREADLHEPRTVDAGRAARLDFPAEHAPAVETRARRAGPRRGAMGCRPPALRPGPSLRRGILSQPHRRADRETRRSPGRRSRRALRDARASGATALRRNASRPNRHGPSRHGPSAGSPTAASARRRRRLPNGNRAEGRQAEAAARKRLRGAGIRPPASESRQSAPVRAGAEAPSGTAAAVTGPEPVSAIRGASIAEHDLAGIGKRQHRAGSAHRVCRPGARPGDARPMIPRR